MTDVEGTGAKHRTSEEDKEFYAARGKPGYCVAPNSGKFRKGDGRKRGGPRKKRKVRSKTMKELLAEGYVRPIDSETEADALIVELAKRRVRISGKHGGREVELVEAITTQLVGEATTNARARTEFLRRYDRTMARRQKLSDDALGKVLDFINDAHAGRRWKLNDRLIKNLTHVAALHGRQFLFDFMEALDLMEDDEKQPKRQQGGVVVVRDPIPKPEKEDASQPRPAAADASSWAASTVPPRSPAPAKAAPRRGIGDDPMTPGVDWRMGGRPVEKKPE